jgi:hypothetical protein
LTGAQFAGFGPLLPQRLLAYLTPSHGLILRQTSFIGKFHGHTCFTGHATPPQKRGTHHKKNPRRMAGAPWGKFIPSLREQDRPANIWLTTYGRLYIAHLINFSPPAARSEEISHNDYLPL